MNTITKPNPLIKPQSFKIDNSSDKLYYNSKDLNVYDPEFYYGCKTKPRMIIQKKKIPESDYIYANLKLKEWNESTADCKKAQLLISKSWVDKYFFKAVQPSSTNFIEKNIEAVKPMVVQSEPTVVESEPIVVQSEPVIETNTISQSEDTDIVEKAPPLLQLNESEKFKDCDGNSIEIEVRGERSEDKIYFKVKSVSEGFDMPNIHSILINSDKDGYEKNRDYKYFFIRVISTIGKGCTIKKVLYLTYEGLLRVLFVSRNRNATIFRKWATHKLFTIQMGSKEEKIKLGTDILNISAKTYKAVFDTYATKFPCIYLLSLGKVSQLRETFKLDNTLSDDSTVYKYGFTDDLSRRIVEHDAKYGKLTNVSIKLSTFHIIDVKYTNDAEKDVRELCSAFDKKLSIDGYNELIILNEKEHTQIKKQYKYIGNEYAGATQELQSQIIELKDKIKDFENEIVNLKMSHKSELLEKDIKINQETTEKQLLKMQLDTNQIIYNLEKQNYTLQIQMLSKSV